MCSFQGAKEGYSTPTSSDVIGDFKLKSKSAVGSGTTLAPTTRTATDSDIFICYNVATEKLSVFIDYNGFATSASTYSADIVTETTSGVNYIISE
ncbi:MAG: hypothetical protein PHF63_12175 [Herbinix sp.]|nr:hypothetical protein [Herbinix sp.]